MHQLNNFLICPVPVGAFKFYENPKGVYGVMLAGPKGSFYSTHHDLNLPPGKWECICTGTEVDETLAAQMVEDPVTYGMSQIFTEYRKEYAAMRESEGKHVTDYCPRTALESWHSWLQAFSYTPDTVIILNKTKN